MRTAEDLLNFAQSLWDARWPNPTDNTSNYRNQDGNAPNRRTGNGKEFWQFRPYQKGDRVRDIDWKRSARAQSIYIRQNEETTAPIIGFWADPSAGFDWHSGVPLLPEPNDQGAVATSQTPSTFSAKSTASKHQANAIDDTQLTKAEWALILYLALAIHLSQKGFKPRAIGDFGPIANAGNISNLATLLCERPELSRAHQRLDYAFIASDFYGDLEELHRAISNIIRPDGHIILLRVCDPAEIDFPYTGHTQFSDPNSARKHVFGRAENIRNNYLEAFEKQSDTLRQLCDRNGWSLIETTNAEDHSDITHTILGKIMTAPISLGNEGTIMPEMVSREN